MGCAVSSAAVGGSPVMATTPSPLIQDTPRKLAPDPAPAPENTDDEKEPNGEEPARPKSRWAWEFILPPSPTPTATSLRDVPIPRGGGAVGDEVGAGADSEVGEGELTKLTPSAQRRHSMV